MNLGVRYPPVHVSPQADPLFALSPVPRVSESNVATLLLGHQTHLRAAFSFYAADFSSTLSYPPRSQHSSLSVFSGVIFVLALTADSLSYVVEDTTPSSKRGSLARFRASLQTSGDVTGNPRANLLSCALPGARSGRACKDCFLATICVSS